MIRTVRAIRAPEGIAQRAAAAAASLALHREVQLVEVLRLELQGVQGLVGLDSACLVLCLETLGETAGAILARAALLPRLGLALGSCRIAALAYERRT